MPIEYLRCRNGTHTTAGTGTFGDGISRFSVMKKKVKGSDAGFEVRLVMNGRSNDGGTAM